MFVFLSFLDIFRINRFADVFIVPFYQSKRNRFYKIFLQKWRGVLAMLGQL